MLMASSFFCPMIHKIQIHLCPSPELYSLYHKDEAVVIVVDIFRATTTMTTALWHGAEGILPVASTDECQRLGEQYGYLMAAERAVRRCPFAQLGNDPAEYTPQRIAGKRIVMTTTNGTRSLTIARDHGARHILIGSLLNLSATLDYCLSLDVGHIVVLAAGWQGQASMEDMLYAGALSHLASQRGVGQACGDAAVMMRDLWCQTSLTHEERCAYITHSEHYERLAQAGHSSAVSYCMQTDICPLVIGLDETREWLRPLPAEPSEVYLSPLGETSEHELHSLHEAYLESFPIDEQRPWAQIIAPTGALTPYAIRQSGGEVVGLITLWPFAELLYVEHFVLLPQKRGGGLGGSLLRRLMTQHLAPGQTLILEAEPRSCGEMASRRIAFYERQGLLTLDYPYIQPAYTPLSQPVRLSLLSSQELTALETKRIVRILHREVYGCDPLD